MTKWYSSDEENFDHTDIEDAVREVFDDPEVKVGAVRLVWEGDAAIPKAGEFVPAGIINDLNACACDLCGYHAADWPDCTNDQEKDLEQRIAAAVNAWANDHGMQPTFGTVDNVRGIEVKLLSEDGEWEHVCPENNQ